MCGNQSPSSILELDTSPSSSRRGTGEGLQTGNRVPFSMTSRASLVRSLLLCRRASSLPLGGTSSGARSWWRRAASVWSFGDNSNGALGLPFPIGDAYEPTEVPSVPSDGVVSVAAGHYHSLAVTGDGQVWAWGRNEEGQLGRLPDAPRVKWNNPERVRGLDDVRVQAVFASGVVSAAVAEDGSLWVWGRSKRGQLGLGTNVTEAAKPTRVQALSGHEIVKVSFGWGHALALTKEGKLFGWGYSENGRLGKEGQVLERPLKQQEKIGESAQSSTSLLELAEKLVAERIEKEKNMPIIWEPFLVQEMVCHEVSDVSCGLDHSLVLCKNGDLLSCGDNIYGQLGRRSEESEMLPVTISNCALSLSAGVGHSMAVCGVSYDEQEMERTCVFSWGWNRSHQLGRKGQEDIPEMVQGFNEERPVSVSAGRVHSIALTAKGEVWAWGSGRNGRLGTGSSVDEMEPAIVESLEGLKVLQAVAGFDHNLLLVADQ